MKLTGEFRIIWWPALKALGSDIANRNVSLIAAGVAFFGMLALFPGLAAFVAIWGVFADPVAVTEQISALRELVPDDVFTLIEGQLVELASTRKETLGWAGFLSILLALWSARAGVAAMMKGLNEVHRAPNRSGLAHYARAVSLTLMLVLVGFVAMIAVVVVPIVLKFVNLGTLATIVIEALRWIVGLMVLLTGVALLYRYGPNRKGQKMPWITPGAILSVLAWMAVSIAFSVYISQFDSYNKTYGSIGAVIAMLMWLYLSSFMVLLGAGLNAHLERQNLLKPAQDSRQTPDPVADRTGSDETTDATQAGDVQKSAVLARSE